MQQAKGQLNKQKHQTNQSGGPSLASRSHTNFSEAGQIQNPRVEAVGWRKPAVQTGTTLRRRGFRRLKARLKTALWLQPVPTGVAYLSGEATSLASITTREAKNGLPAATCERDSPSVVRLLRQNNPNSSNGGNQTNSPESQINLPFTPSLHFEVMVNRTHQENSLTR